MAKIGIYIPDDMVDEIEKWRAKMNFSRIFVEAFERAVLESADEDRVTKKELRVAVQRMKKAMGRDAEQGRKDGVELGRHWALELAPRDKLRAVASGRSQPDDLERFVGADYDRAPPGDMAYLNDRFPHHGHNVQDWEAYNSGRNEGFVEGATQVWNRLAPAFEP
ncbi:MAG: hypothetical protein KY475_10490 [Planctomycetes bacterium]|nr:hypothetical protein [Planctomycetota bacterium]